MKKNSMQLFLQFAGSWAETGLSGLLLQVGATAPITLNTTAANTSIYTATTTVQYLKYSKVKKPPPSGSSQLQHLYNNNNIVQYSTVKNKNQLHQAHHNTSIYTTTTTVQYIQYSKVKKPRPLDSSGLIPTAANTSIFIDNNNNIVQVQYSEARSVQSPPSHLTQQPQTQASIQQQQQYST